MSVHGGVHGPGGGGCMVRGGLHGPGGGGCMVPRGVCLVETPLRTATAAGGTHPTGMHSCFVHGFTFKIHTLFLCAILFLKLLKKKKVILC